MTAKEFYEQLASQNIRIFGVSIDSDVTLIMHNRTLEDWRADMRQFISEINSECPNVREQLFEKLQAAGYVDVLDVAAGVYVGHVKIHSASIEESNLKWLRGLLKGLGVAEEDYKTYLEEKYKDKA